MAAQNPMAMNLVQFNPRVPSNQKQKVRLDSVRFKQTNDVIATAILADFFKRYRAPAKREEIYRQMQKKMNGAAKTALAMDEQKFPVPAAA